MPVFLRWLLIDLAIKRLMRRRGPGGYGSTVRGYGPNRPPLMGPYPRRYTVPATFLFRRPLLGCGTGCLTMLGLSVLASLLLGALMNLTLH